MSHNFIPGSGTKSPANSNGHGNGHGLLTGELASADPIPSIPPWTGEKFDIPTPLRNSQKSSSAERSKKRKRGLIDSVQRSTPTAIEFTELKDGSLIDLVENPDDPKKTLLAVWKDGKTTYHSRLERGREVLVPLLRDGAIFQHVRLPHSAEPYGSVLKLCIGLLKLITDCVDIKEE